MVGGGAIFNSQAACMKNGPRNREPLITCANCRLGAFLPLIEVFFLLCRQCIDPDAHGL